MLVSYNEILMLCHKVFEARGFAVGAVEDSAETIATLERHGYPALTVVHTEIAQWRPLSHPLTIKRDQQPHHSLLLASDASLLQIAPLAIDYAYAQAVRDGAHTITLPHIHYPLLALPYAEKCARRGCIVTLKWGQGSTIVSHSQSERANSNGLSPVATTLRIRVEIKGEDASINPPLAFPNSISVDDTIWYDLQHLAKGVLVASSEQSRQRGAGEQVILP